MVDYLAIWKFKGVPPARSVRVRSPSFAGGDLTSSSGQTDVDALIWEFSLVGLLQSPARRRHRYASCWTESSRVVS